jgi:hypothetical protein
MINLLEDIHKKFLFCLLEIISMRIFLQSVCASIFFFLASLVPLFCFAFEVSPAVSDISFSGDDVTQVISVKNTDADARLYRAEVQEVYFAPDGTIAEFVPPAVDLGAAVTPTYGEITTGGEQLFTVSFLHPEYVLPDDVFALVVYEQQQATQVAGGFIALLFPSDFFQDAPGSFRIDAFQVFFDEAGIQGVAQMTNTSDVLVRPTSMIIVTDVFGRELGRFAFAAYEGRLPVGTTRVVHDVFPFTGFGFWHVGGRVNFTLLSVGDGEGGEIQHASVTLETFPGKGMMAIVCGIAVLFMVGIILWKKRTGILRS